MSALPVAHASERLRFVEDQPLPDAIAECVRNDLCVIGETIGGLTIGPATGVLERLRQIPVIQRGNGTNARLQNRVREPLVIVESLLVRFTASIWLNARPGNG